MPRATTDRMSRTHSTAPSSASQRPNSSSSSSNSNSNHSSNSNSSQTTKNPIFNTSRFGQHILKNPLVAQGIVDKANLKPTDVVLEVGPGTGNLTVRILAASKKTIAVEMDPRMAAELSKRVQGKPEQRKLDIMIGDFCKTDLPFFDVCISNTPYQISSPLVFKLLSHRPLFRCAILMFQREFAHRLLAKPGSPLWCRLSANVQLYSIVTHVLAVSRNSFRPPPQVESTVVKIVPRNPPPPISFEEFDGLNRIVFSRRNKTIRASFFGAKGVLEMLKGNWKTLRSEREEPPLPADAPSFSSRVDKILTDTGYTEQRAAKMDIDDLLTLLSAFHDEGIHFS